MRNARKLYLQRGLTGERWDLNGAGGVYAGDLAGLGVNFSPSFYDLGDGFFQVNDERKVPQGSPGFTLRFTSSAYATYRQLVDWIAASPELYLVYCPYGDMEFLRRIKLSYLSKGERNQLGWLEVPASVLAMTPWFRPVPASIGMVVQTGTFKAYLWDEDEQDYGYRYTDDLVYPGDAEGVLSALLAPAGHIPAALVLRYHGAVEKPVLRLVGASTGKVYGICALNAGVGVSLGATDTLEYSTLQTDCHVRRISADGEETNLLPFVDLSQEDTSREIYFRLPVTESAVLSLESPAAFSGEAELTVYYFYGSV